MDGRQAGLGQDAGHTIAMQVELRGDGADRPAFGVVVAQNLRFGFRGNGHGSSGQVGVGESDSAGSPGVPSLARGAGIDSNASASEDFAYYGQLMPSLFIFIGATQSDQDMSKAAPNHSPLFTVDDAALKTGIESHMRFVMEYPKAAAQVQNAWQRQQSPAK